jgi:hypothetical protein
MNEAALWHKIQELQILLKDMTVRLEALENASSGSQSRLEAVLSVAESNN